MEKEEGNNLQWGEKGSKVYNSKYQKISFIGQGAYGKIYLVKNLEDGGMVAMKKFYSEQKSRYFDVKFKNSP